MKKLFKIIIFVSLLFTTVHASDIKQILYESRYQKWLPYISNNLVITIGIGGRICPSQGLWSGLFSSHQFLREPDAMRLDGTPITAQAIISTEKIKIILKLIDKIGTFDNFSTYSDDNWKASDPKWACIEVVCTSEKQGHTYDRYILPNTEMYDILKQLREAIKSKGAEQVIEGLIEGCIARQKAEKQK